MEHLRPLSDKMQFWRRREYEEDSYQSRQHTVEDNKNRITSFISVIIL